jgi:hypothetical protein
MEEVICCWREAMVQAFVSFYVSCRLTRLSLRAHPQSMSPHACASAPTNAPPSYYMRPLAVTPLPASVPPRKMAALSS